MKRSPNTNPNRSLRVEGSVYSKKSLTEPTLLEMSGFDRRRRTSANSSKNSVSCVAFQRKNLPPAQKKLRSHQSDRKARPVYKDNTIHSAASQPGNCHEHAPFEKNQQNRIAAHHPLPVRDEIAPANTDVRRPGKQHDCH